MNDTPDLFRLDGAAANHWLTLQLVGTTSNRSAIGARVRVVTGGELADHEVRGGGSYISQNDLRVHVGLGARDARRSRRGALAERARGALERRRGRPGADADGRTRHARWEGRRDDECPRASWLPASWLRRVALAGACAAQRAARRPSRPRRSPTRGRSSARTGRKDAIDDARGRSTTARPDAWPRVLGVAYYHADDYVEAIELLAPVVDRLAADSVERREAVQVLGLSYYLAGRLAEALPLLEETRAWAADNMELAQVLGMAYIQTRQPDKAREALARAFGVAPDRRRRTCSPRR